jgi:LPXTG-motif cell wall-anchored protein
MRIYASLGSLALALVPALALAQQPAACERVEFSEEVLARFPNIRAACLDVIDKGGVMYAVVKANLVRATSRRMTVQIKRPDGSLSEPIGVNLKSNERINIAGRMTRIQDVAIGQELTAYIHVTDPGIALASDIEDVEFTPVPASPEPAPAASAAPDTQVADAPAPEMPKTASNLPLAGTIGIALLALGAGIALARRRVKT